MNEIIKVIKNKMRSRMGSKEINIISHADDEVLIARE
jgi:capsular polysaccharide biosynthesis protein